MKALIYHSYDDIRLQTSPIPSIAAGELLVKVHGCGLCGSDILKIAQQATPPVVLGHELTGTIVERGSDVSSFEVGQRVVVAHHVPCGTCHYCRHDNYSMCANFKTSNIDPCGFADYIRVPAAHVQHTTLALPDNVSAEVGSFTEPLACCIRAVKRTPLLDGDSVIVVGLGSIGLLMVQALKADALDNNRHIQVFGVDLFPQRLQLACDLGADVALPAPNDEQGLRALLNTNMEGRGADAAILTVAGARPFLQAVAAVRKGGTVNIFAAHNGAVPVNLETLYQQELTITSTYSSSPDELRTALHWLSSGKVRVNNLISHRLPLERFAEGVQLMREHTALKVYFHIAGETNKYGKYTV